MGVQYLRGKGHLNRKIINKTMDSQCPISTIFDAQHVAGLFSIIKIAHKSMFQNIL
jgi:hypothetical protein